MRSPMQETTKRETAPYGKQRSVSSSSSSPDEEILDTQLQSLPERAVKLSQETADAFLARATDLHRSALQGFEQQRDRAADTLERLGRALAFVGAEGTAQDESMAQHFESTTARIQNVAEYIASASPLSLSEDLTRLTRARPVAVVSATLVAGALLGRFLKASQKKSRSATSVDRHKQSQSHRKGGNHGLH